MNSIDLLENLKKYPVFDMPAFAEAAGLEPASAKVRLFRMKNKGRILEIQRNSYTVLRDPLIIASRVVWPSYISLWYALRYHQMTAQIVHGIDVLSPRATFRRSIDFLGTQIYFVRISPEFLYGYDRLNLQDHEVFMAYPEKALVDALHLRKISVAEVFEIIYNNRKKLNIERLVDYTKRSKDNATIRRIGYLLDRIGHHRKELLTGQRDLPAIPLDYSFPSEGSLNRKWKIIVNMEAQK